MGSKSADLSKKLQDHVLGGPDYTRPGTVYIALYSVTPDDDGGGTELSGGSYARVAVTNNATNFPASTGGTPAVKSIGVDTYFPWASALWDEAVAFAIWDDATAGNEMLWSLLATPKIVQDGDRAVFRAGELSWTES